MKNSFYLENGKVNEIGQFILDKIKTGKLNSLLRIGIDKEAQFGRVFVKNVNNTHLSIRASDEFATITLKQFAEFGLRLNLSKAGSTTSKEKAKASRENGKLGGRPKKS